MIDSSLPRLGEKEFKQLSHFIESEIGIKMPPEKRILMEARLQKRLKKYGMTNFRAYCDFVFKEGSAHGELSELIDAITTNKTDFMREANHFDYMVDKALPDLVNSRGDIKIWSAASSTGQEPYNLAMFMEEFNLKGRPVEYSVTATDINQSCIVKARRAIYNMDDIEDVPLDFKKKYFLRSRDPQSTQVRIKARLREKVRFQALNLMNESYGMKDKYDIVFCRNVLIYFDKDNQRKVIDRIISHMTRGSYLFLGHSESMAGVNSSLKGVASSIYRKM